MIEALIFDFDGLILDTETPEFIAWREIYESYGVTLPRAAWIDAIGRGHEQAAFDPYAVLEAALGQPLDRSVIRAARRSRYLSLIAAQPVRPGIENYLREAREMGLKLAVASSSDRAWVEGHLTERGLLPYFDLTRCADDVTRTKPDPEVYLSAVAGLGVSAARTIAFEDSPNGARAAKAAGLFCVGIPNSMTAGLLEGVADIVIESAGDVALQAVLDRATTPSPYTPES